MIARFIRLATIGIAVGILSATLVYLAAAATLESMAWERAGKIAHVTSKEAKSFIVPKVMIHPFLHFIPLSPTDGFRECGEFTVSREGDDFQHSKLSYYINVWARPTGEEKLIMDALTHEFLHAIWLQRTIVNPSFEEKNPKSEEWVQSVFPVMCPSN